MRFFDNSVSEVFAAPKVVFVARRYVAFSFIRPVIKPFITAVLMGGFIILTRGMINSLPILFAEILLSGGVYFLITFLLMKKEMLGAVRLIKDSIR